METASTNLYSEFAPYYDLMTTSGYYDYHDVAKALHRILEGRKHILELGVGTGLVLENLISLDPTLAKYTVGLDHTEEMLALARKRLNGRVTLIKEDVTQMSLGHSFQAIFSHGGPWGFKREGNDYVLQSMIPDSDQEMAGLKNVAKHLTPEGLFILNIQPMHVNMEYELPDGITYSQEITQENGLLGKHYIFSRGDAIVASQKCRYRIWRGSDIDDLLRHAGFSFNRQDETDNFRIYTKL